MHEKNYHPRYRPDIDGLRALAVLAVVFFHAAPSMLPGGFIGVDIFFVISGYLISTIIFRSLEKEDFSFTEFYAHRVKRIFPALILVLAATYIVGYLALLPDEFKQVGKHITASSLFVQNFALWLEDGYFDTATKLKPLMHLWSLGIEEQFYLIYPLILWVGWRMRVKMIILISLIALASFALNLVRIQSDPVATFFLPDTRFWELMAGGILAWNNLFKREKFILMLNRWTLRLNDLTPSGTKHSTLPANLAAFSGLVLITASFFWLEETRPFPGWRALPPALGAWLVIAAGQNTWINRKILSNRILVLIGLISYPLYLWHWPLLSYAEITEPAAPSLKIRLGSVAISFVLAWLTYRLIERPIRLGRKNWNQSVILCGLLSVVAYTGYKTYEFDGLAYRTQEQNEAAELFKWPTNLRSSTECLREYGLAERDFCVRTKPGAVDAILIGDSHANHLFPGLSFFYQKENKNLLQIGRGGCVPFFGITRHRSDGKIVPCEKQTNFLLNHAIHNDSISTIILSSRGAINITGTGFGLIPKEAKKRISLSLPSAPDLKSNAEIYEASMRDTLSQLVDSGKRIIFVIDIPELGFNPESCVETRPLRLTNFIRKPCAISRADTDERTHEYWTLVSNILNDFPSVEVFNPIRHLCDSEYCWAMKDNKLLYRDDDHLSMIGSRYIAERLAKKLF